MTNTPNQPSLEDLIKKIKESWGDWEAVHGYYDDAMRLIAEKDHKLLVRKLDKAVEGASFWYA